MGKSRRSWWIPSGGAHLGGDGGEDAVDEGARVVGGVGLGQLHRLVEDDGDGPPMAVVIDEAVELAKTYSTDDSGSFVNGILSTIAPALRPA